MDPMQQKMGYWLQGKQIYYPLQAHVKPYDEHIHWYICVK